MSESLPTAAAGNAFTGGGVTPQQASLSQFTRGERTLGAEGRFAGMPMSTGLTQLGTVGPEVGQAINLAQISDQLASAQAKFANAQQLSSKGLTGQEINTVGNALGKLRRSV